MPFSISLMDSDRLRNGDFEAIAIFMIAKGAFHRSSHGLNKSALSNIIHIYICIDMVYIAFVAL